VRVSELIFVPNCGESIESTGWAACFVTDPRHLSVISFFPYHPNAPVEAAPSVAALDREIG